MAARTKDIFLEYTGPMWFIPNRNILWVARPIAVSIRFSILFSILSWIPAWHCWWNCMVSLKWGFIFKACYSNSWRRRCCHDRCRREFTQTPRKKVKKKRRRKCGGCKIGVVERRWRGCSRETLKKKSRRIIWRILTDPLPKRRRRRNDKDKEHRKEANTTFKTGSASWEYNSLLSRCPKRNINIWDQVLIWKKRLGRGDPGINSLDGIDKQHDNN